MKNSDSISKISAALVKAQINIGSAQKSTKNSYFKSSYATLGDVMEVVKSPLLEQGISVIQPVGMTDSGETYVETVLLHETGEYISDRMKVSVAKEKDPQAQGSAITYARRYSLQSMLFVPAEDDDGEGAMGRKTEAKSEPKAPKKELVKTETTPESVMILAAQLNDIASTPEEFMDAMKAAKKIPAAAGDFWKMKGETAETFLFDFSGVKEIIRIYKEKTNQ